MAKYYTKIYEIFGTVFIYKKTEKIYVKDMVNW